MINTQKNLAKNEAFQKKWKQLSLICKIRIAINGVFLGFVLWFLILWNLYIPNLYLYALPTALVINLALLTRTAYLKPHNRCWLQFYYILDILNAISFFFILYSYPVLKNQIIFIFEAPLLSPKFFIVITLIISVLQTITMIVNLVVCSQLLCCSGYDAHLYTQITNPSHHTMSQVLLPGDLDQPQLTHRRKSSSNQFTVDTSADAKLIVDV